MNRLILALAFTPALFSTAALAQTVPDDVAKELWCGSAFVAAFSNPPPGVPSEQLALAQNYIDQGTWDTSGGGQGDSGYVDSGTWDTSNNDQSSWDNSGGDSGWDNSGGGGSTDDTF